MKASIIYRHFFDYEGQTPLIGGIQTYILQLAMLLCDTGFETVVYQPSYINFEKNHNGFRIIGLPFAKYKEKKQIKLIYDKVKKESKPERDLIIFAADHFSLKNDYPKALSIQHGISWDLPVSHLTEKKFFQKYYGGLLKKLYSCFNAKRSFENCRYMVCVDYNFLNWYRTFSCTLNENSSWVIPNFCTSFAKEEEVSSRFNKNSRKRILFARRFTKYRGINLMMDAAEKLINKYPELSFTFAGEGPEEASLRQRFNGEHAVKIIKYLPENCLEVLMDHDIAIIPSLASEGTSLAVAEAMGSGCVVVATGVGGITNMVIDGYNGLLITPNVDSIVSAVETIINNPDSSIEVAINGYNTAKNAFCLQRWQQQWLSVIEKISK
jgi:glycosyltransferase involved in cell wall biosynthesis